MNVIFQGYDTRYKTFSIHIHTQAHNFNKTGCSKSLSLQAFRKTSTSVYRKMSFLSKSRKTGDAFNLIFGWHPAVQVGEKIFLQAFLFITHPFQISYALLHLFAP